MLPEEDVRPLADFVRRMRERQRSERLPDALFPDNRAIVPEGVIAPEHPYLR